MLLFMNEKINISALAGVPRTLLIPLSGRSLAFKKYPELNFKDPLAEDIMGKIHFDLSEFSFDEMSMKGSIARAHLMDEITKKFFEKKPKALGISLGCGLCTRFWRIDNGAMSWLDVDFPEVIELREKLLSKNDREVNLASSLLSDDWIKKAKILNQGPWFISIEGVLMYLKPKEVAHFFEMLALHAPSGSQILFDYTHPTLIKWGIKPRAVINSKTSFYWGLKDLKEIENISSRYFALSAPITFNLGNLYRWGNRLVSFCLRGEVYALAHFVLK